MLWTWSRLSSSIALLISVNNLLKSIFQAFVMLVRFCLLLLDFSSAPKGCYILTRLCKLSKVTICHNYVSTVGAYAYQAENFLHLLNISCSARQLFDSLIKAFQLIHYVLIDLEVFIQFFPHKSIHGKALLRQANFFCVWEHFPHVNSKIVTQAEHQGLLRYRLQRQLMNVTHTDILFNIGIFLGQSIYWAICIESQATCNLRYDSLIDGTENMKSSLLCNHREISPTRQHTSRHYPDISRFPCILFSPKALQNTCHFLPCIRKCVIRHILYFS